MSKYNSKELKVGDKVKILDFKKLPDNTNCGKVEEMFGYINREYYISKISIRGNIYLQGIFLYCFAPNWLKRIF